MLSQLPCAGASAECFMVVALSLDFLLPSVFLLLLGAACCLIVALLLDVIFVAARCFLPFTLSVKVDLLLRDAFSCCLCCLMVLLVRSATRCHFYCCWGFVAIYSPCPGRFNSAWCYLMFSQLLCAAGSAACSMVVALSLDFRLLGVISTSAGCCLLLSCGSIFGPFTVRCHFYCCWMFSAFYTQCRS